MMHHQYLYPVFTTYFIDDPVIPLYQLSDVLIILFGHDSSYLDIVFKMFTLLNNLDMMEEAYFSEYLLLYSAIFVKSFIALSAHIILTICLGSF